MSLQHQLKSADKTTSCAVKAASPDLAKILEKEKANMNEQKSIKNKLAKLESQIDAVEEAGRPRLLQEIADLSESLIILQQTHQELRKEKRTAKRHQNATRARDQLHRHARRKQPLRWRRREKQDASWLTFTTRESQLDDLRDVKIHFTLCPLDLGCDVDSELRNKLVDIGIILTPQIQSAPETK
ncbi:hypothetical protein GUITHDRAFT_147141 [Guillardia theta CCMP2712]|uniref:Uncharacterized protein n=1 Tax=Guillardia theta (strain CCMP2712) TaxID=905079 RepID=L1IE73_GUITC|nr:hypothetical protein GUITHDRAFT_147141 [Guillardia theta CCMP2712]EKX34528.1 hypothetical protein GUITHDRAFT_147141 [Guillardia theta CCMP2712]|eukprot:XP_005821508.1 hypothetical protein GUITHDRAFT_147141 [Guillardia theta CCMP2712]